MGAVIAAAAAAAVVYTANADGAFAGSIFSKVDHGIAAVAAIVAFGGSIVEARLISCHFDFCNIIVCFYCTQCVKHCRSNFVKNAMATVAPATAVADAARNKVGHTTCRGTSKSTKQQCPVSGTTTACMPSRRGVLIA